MRQNPTKKMKSISPHQACRSLLQKAVRRGDVELVERVANHLIDAGEGNWLKGRAYVIAFEECWPIFGGRGGTLHEPMDLLLKTTTAVKNKNAAGLGSLAYALSQGDRTCLEGGANEKTLRIIASGMIRPGDFWAWARSKTGKTPANDVVLAAQQSYKYAGWQWDKTILLAAAYLAATEELPEVRTTEKCLPCPLWVGIDKHTEAGKTALQNIAKSVKIPSRTVSLLSFYFEGALCNELEQAYWWDQELTWRLNQIGENQKSALEKWFDLRSRLEIELALETESFENHLKNGVGESLKLF